MKNWTIPAESRLNEYLEEWSVREGLDAEGSADMKDDLRRHIHEEAELAPGEIVGLMQLENILGRLDAGYHPAPPSSPPERAPARVRGFIAWTFGVVLPLAVLVFEVMTSFCGSVFFSPVPTWWHVAWIAAVPFTNAWLMKWGGPSSDKARGIAAGFATATAFLYALLFLPLMHWSLLALIFFGIGFLSLSPLLSLLVSWRVSSRAKSSSDDPSRFKNGWQIGVLAALAVLLALEGPAMWTRVNLSTAARGGAEAPAAISRLRFFHSERSLLSACYDANRFNGGTDISGWVMKQINHPTILLGGNVESEQSNNARRDVFFRVTGKPFNSLKPPEGNLGNSWSGRGRGMNEFEFDPNVGGDEVAMRLRSLDLAESRFDGHVDGLSQTGYGEWTMVFKNNSVNPQEARCQVKLPTGGRVSRLTLWVNGEPREAAFSSVSQVKAAYKAVAVVRRQDPVLVNMVGPDTVMVQCFPVPAQGEMKIRFGVSAPLTDTRWELPYIAERNFGTIDKLEHAVWMQGDVSFTLAGTGGILKSAADGPAQSLSATLGTTSITSPGTMLFTVTLPEQPSVVWCEDRFAKPEERILIREPITVSRSAAKNLIVVIDGSASLTTAKNWIVNSLTQQNQDRVKIIIADDINSLVTLQNLKDYRFSGGRDNAGALKEGLKLAKENGGEVVWIHGPQAVTLTQSASLLQLLERGSVRPVIHEIEAVPGPNRLGEAIYRTGCLVRVPSFTKPETEFATYLTKFITDRQETQWKWTRAAAPGETSGKQVWDHLARLWAASTAEDLRSGLKDDARSQLAASYQLVTPFSGAVVLETQRQFDEFGLKPVDGDSTPKIPNVPEPSSGILVMMATAAALLRRKRSSDPANG